MNEFFILWLRTGEVKDKLSSQLPGLGSWELVSLAYRIAELSTNRIKEGERVNKRGYDMALLIAITQDADVVSPFSTPETSAFRPVLGVWLVRSTVQN